MEGSDEEVVEKRGVEEGGVHGAVELRVVKGGGVSVSRRLLEGEGVKFIY